MRIKYKEQNINLNKVYYLEKGDYGLTDYRLYFLHDCKTPFSESMCWYFKTKEERDKVYNLIMNNYFTDIEELANNG
jgi:hypothetical protein